MKEQDQGCRHRSTQKISKELVKKVSNKNAKGTRLEEDCDYERKYAKSSKILGKKVAKKSSG